MTLVTPSGVITVSPDRDPELFWATAGGMGLTGVVVSAILRLIPIETSWMQVDSQRFTRLDDLMSTMEKPISVPIQRGLAGLCRPPQRRSSVSHAWRPRSSGTIPERLRERSREVPGDPRFRVPRSTPGRLVNRLSVRAFNEAWFRASRIRGDRSVPGRRSFTRSTAWGGGISCTDHGFVQYQFAVPPTRGDVIEDALARSRRRASLLPGRAEALRPGNAWPTLLQPRGLDARAGLPARSGRASGLAGPPRCCRHSCSGRVYLAKDSRLRPDLLPVMYPGLPELPGICRRVDPDGVLASDLSRRLGISP